MAKDACRCPPALGRKLQQTPPGPRLPLRPTFWPSALALSGGPEPPHLPAMHRRHLLSLAALPLLSTPARALDAPDGAVVLTLSGRVRLPNRQAHGEPQADFDMAMLE